jgi:hypothetical protein
MNKFVLGLIVVSAMIISCEAVNGPGDIAGDEAALAASRANVVGININSAAQLAQIGMDPNFPANGNYDLTTDLTLPANWTPICGPGASGPFTGTLDGSGYTITVTGFNISAATDGNLGIFANMVGDRTVYPEIVPTVSNLTVNFSTASSLTIGVSNLGGVAGHASDAAFDTVIVDGSFDINLNDTNQNLGGIVGSVENSQFNSIRVDAGFDISFQGPAAPTPSALNVGGVAGNAQLSQFNSSTIAPSSFDVTSSNIGATIINQGGIAGLAVSSTFDDARIGGTFNGTLNNSAPIVWEKIYIEDTPRFRSIVADPGSDGLNVGGAAGHADASQFSAIYTRGDINANSGRAPVYVGGVVGYAKGSTIEDSHTGVTIIGSGNGYNSSAGGIAGYIVASRVTDSDSGYGVQLSGNSQTFGWNDSWQVYAGGLVGYAGGSDYAPSVIDHSYATGSVSANSPFPYAGGLVGYLYGYNDFTNPAKNGSTVSRSYATGDVTAVSQVDPNKTFGDVPYAGGLVGYSSVKGSTIVDSYATGDATATTQGEFAWAGGIVGGNANDALVLRTYATGNVTSSTDGLPPLYAPQYAPDGPAAGGIAGFNYYTARTLVSDSAALNGTVDGSNSSSQDVVHRIVGSLGDKTGHDGTLNNNYANLNMVVADYWTPHPGPNYEDGVDVPSMPPPQSLYTNDLGWDFINTWQMTGTYPTLR